ncbi:hypothetical protein E2562_011996 [Oryza meyeriana var. granulata]|uniref:Uncharacterized protein n=1 Tax=Oryza meyeriana var. granulata TaxID=110450 RepID=A0A6G1F761_9ORYZ|nr:hypothetical protein E2562_011996 [Oryza meyeriana var. granulata]
MAVAIDGATVAMRRRAETDKRWAMRRRRWHAGEMTMAQDGGVRQPDDSGAQKMAQPRTGNSERRRREGDDDGGTDGETAWQTGDDQDAQR